MQWWLLHAPEYNWNIWGWSSQLCRDQVLVEQKLWLKILLSWTFDSPPGTWIMYRGSHPPASTAIASWSTRTWVHLRSFPLLREGLWSHPIVMRMEVARSTCMPWKHPPGSCSSKCPFRCWEYLSQNKWIKSWQPAIKKHLVPVFTSLCLSPETLHCQERHQLEWPDVKSTWKICEITSFWMAFL